MFRKADVQRLKGMLKALDEKEAELQKRGVPVIPRSVRASNMLDAEALRRVLSKIEAVQPVARRELFGALMQGVQEMAEQRHENAPEYALTLEDEGWWNDEHNIYTWPIQIGEWGARIECHGRTPEDAKALAKSVVTRHAGQPDTVPVKLGLLRRAFAPGPNIATHEEFEAWADDCSDAQDELRALIAKEDA